jgi:hypothetical protein
MHIITVTQTGYECDCGDKRSATSGSDAVALARLHATRNTPAFMSLVQFFPTNKPTQI